MHRLRRLLLLSLFAPSAGGWIAAAAAPPASAPRLACVSPVAWVRRARAASMVAHDLAPHSDSDVRLHGTASLERVVDGLHHMKSDKRRVDELVDLFQYSGVVECDGHRFAGQGAVKRILTALLCDLCVDDVRVEHRAAGAAAITVRLLDASSGTRRELQLLPSFKDGLIEQMDVRETSAPTLQPLIDSYFSGREVSGDGPKWETFDGRVHQRIWAHDGLFEVGNPFIKETMDLSTGRLISIVDRTVWDLYGEKLQLWADSVDLKLDVVIAPGNEDQKTMDTFIFLLDELARVDPLRRSEPVLAIGGGVLTDTTGFACACWRRGIPWCRLPTTLLGIVDASVGIKVAINYKRKNGVGHFFSPLHTFIDKSFLGTLSLADVRSGVGEIMKAALIHDRRLYDLMNEHGEELVESRFQGSEAADEVIKLSIEAMLECIGPDLWEEALLRPMDFGHSFSRTLEADERFFLRHGEAVAIDCIMSSLIAEQQGLLPTEQADELLQLYARLQLPCSIKGITAETYKKARDEITVHRDGLLRAPLPAGIGKCAYVDSMSDEQIERAFARLELFMQDNPQVSWDPSKSFVSTSA